MQIRAACADDLDALLQLYTHLHGEPPPEPGPRLATLWQAILSDKNHHILLGVQGDTLVSSCVLLIVPNLSHGQRPYALIENVVTHPSHRRCGHAGALLHHAGEVARAAQCYKIMLMTGRKDAGTLHFYERAGYNRQDKTAFVRWLE